MMSARRMIFDPLIRLTGNADGTTVIETAIVAPVLVLMSIGSFEASQMFARSSELQTAAAEASAIALANTPDTAAERDTLKAIIVASTGLSANNVTVTAEYRCGSNTDYVTDSTTCGSSTVSSFVKIYMTDTYTPAWTDFGIGGSVTYRMTRHVMMGQS
jgi:Flp pilus assembly protein TadG